MTPGVAVFIFLSAGAIALFSFLSVTTWSDSRRRERTAYYGNETIRKIAEMPAATPASVLEFVREQQRNAERRQREGLKLSGLITAAAGVGIIVFLWELQAGPVYMAGCIPLLIGLALLVYAYILGPKPDKS